MRTVMAILAALALAAGVAPGTARAAEPAKAAGEKAVVRCPVMGEVVEDPSTAAKSVYKGKTYSFCCPGCKPKFDADPERYVGRDGGR